MFNNNPRGMEQEPNSAVKVIDANGNEIKNLDISNYVKKEQFNGKITELDHQIINHINDPSAHDQHINYLIDQKLKEQQNVLTNNNQSNRAWHTSIWAIIVTILGIIASSCISFFF